MDRSIFAGHYDVSVNLTFDLWNVITSSFCPIRYLCKMLPYQLLRIVKNVYGDSKRFWDLWSWEWGTMSSHWFWPLNFDISSGQLCQIWRNSLKYSWDITFTILAVRSSNITVWPCATWATVEYSMQCWLSLLSDRIIHQTSNTLVRGQFVWQFIKHLSSSEAHSTHTTKYNCFWSKKDNNILLNDSCLYIKSISTSAIHITSEISCYYCLYSMWNYITVTWSGKKRF